MKETKYIIYFCQDKYPVVYFVLMSTQSIIYNAFWCLEFLTLFVVFSNKNVYMFMHFKYLCCEAQMSQNPRKKWPKQFGGSWSFLLCHNRCTCLPLFYRGNKLDSDGGNNLLYIRMLIGQSEFKWNQSHAESDTFSIL